MTVGKHWLLIFATYLRHTQTTLFKCPSYIFGGKVLHRLVLTVVNFFKKVAHNACFFVNGCIGMWIGSLGMNNCSSLVVYFEVLRLIQHSVQRACYKVLHILKGRDVIPVVGRDLTQNLIFREVIWYHTYEIAKLGPVECHFWVFNEFLLNIYKLT